MRVSEPDATKHTQRPLNAARACVYDSSHTQTHAPNLIISTILTDKLFLAVVVGGHKFPEMTAVIYATVTDFCFFFEVFFVVMNLSRKKKRLFLTLLCRAVCVKRCAPCCCE